MRILKLFILAACIGGALLIAWLLYPDRIEQVFAELNGETNTVTRGDVAIFAEAISAGFAIGFYILKSLFAKFGNQQAAQMVKADRLEVQTVFVFITGLSFFMGSLSLFEESIPQGSFHLLAGLACMMYLPIWYVMSLRKKRSMTLEQNKQIHGTAYRRP